MASATPAAGEVGYEPNLSGCLNEMIAAARNPMPVPTEAPGIERIASVRILRENPCWRGIVLRLADPFGTEERFEMALNAGGGRSVTIAAVDGDEAIALWRDCGRASGLALLLESVDHVITEPFPQLGRLALGPVRIRRGYSLLKQRRPRFLTRRKTGRLPLLPVVVSGQSLTDGPAS